MMKTYRKPPVLLLLMLMLVHLIGDAAAGRDNGSVSTIEKQRAGEVILEEVIITGSGNDTRVTADAVAKDPTQLEDAILSLLSKREIQRERRRARRPSSKSDQDASQSRTVIRNDNDDPERLKHAIAEYEPRRITSRKTKRKIADGPNVTHDARGTSGQSAVSATADLQRTYHEVLRNISRDMPTLIASNVAAFNYPYLSQVTKSLKQIRVPEAIVFTDNVTEKSSSFNSTGASPVTPRKRKKLLKKYRPAAASRLSSVGGSKPDEEAGTDNGSIEEYLAGGKPLNNASSPTRSASSAHSAPTEGPGNRREWNLQESSTTIPSFIPPPNTSDVYNANLSVYDPNNFNVPSGANAPLYSPPRYNAVLPRPFAVSRLSDLPLIGNLEVPYRKPSSSPVNLRPQPIAHSPGNVPPLVLPTDLFHSAVARSYAPIKRANRLKPDEKPVTIVSTEASPPTIPLAGGIAFTKPSVDYGASYADVIGTARSPSVAHSGRRTSSKSDYYPIITRNVAETAKPAAAYGQASVLRDLPVTRKNDFQPRIDTLGRPDDSDRNFNIGLALYNNFANVYSADAPKAQDYQNFQQSAPISQQAPALPYHANLKSNALPLPKVRPIATVKPALAPYYDSRLLVSRKTSEKEPSGDKTDKKSAETNEQTRVEDAHETEGGTVDDDNNFGNDQTRTNYGTYKVREMPNQQREKDDSEEDRYQQQTRDYHDRQHGHGDENECDKCENVRLEDEEEEEDEEEPDETQGNGHVSVEEDENEQNRDYHRYDRNKYDREDPEEEQSDDREGYENRKNHRDKSDDRADVKRKTVSKQRYSNSRHNGDENYKQSKEQLFDRYDRKKSARDDDRRGKKNRHDREDPENESVAEDKLMTRRLKDDQDRRRKEHEKKRVNDGYSLAHEYRHRETAPRGDSRRERHRHEEYSETNPKQVRKEYHRHHRHGEDDHRRHDDHDDHRDDREAVGDHVHGETQEHAHQHKEHHEKKKHGGNYEEGEGAEHKEEHDGHEGEKGKKGYKVWHENEKAEKGHHDKEHATKEYDEKDGKEKKHEEEGGYHEEHHHGEEGEKKAEFGEKGEHKKGHSTHGEHSVHKKDEYEKKTEFFDEFHEDGDMEKHGEHHHEHESKKGGHEKKGHHDAADHEEKHGKEEKHEKGGHHHEHKGHKIEEGDDHHYDHDEKYGRKKGHEHGKKWSFEKGDDGGGGGHKHHR